MKKYIWHIIVIIVIVFFVYHTLHYGAVNTRKTEAEMLQWKYSWLSRQR